VRRKFFEIWDVESSNVMDPSNTIYLHYLIDNFEIKQIEGKLLTIVESIGLPDTQEKAVKGLVRQAVWDVVEKPPRQIINEHEGHKLYLFMQELEKSRIGGSVATVDKKKSK
jgi:hypothetical protein